MGTSVRLLKPHNLKCGLLRSPRSGMSLFNKLASDDPTTYAVGQDGGMMADLAAAIARGEVRDLSGAEDFVGKRGENKENEEEKAPAPPRMDYEFTGLSIWLEVS